MRSKTDDVGVFALPVKTYKADATEENEKKVEDVVVPEIKAKETELEVEQKAAFYTGLNDTEKELEAKENDKGAVHEVEPKLFLPVKTKVGNKK